MDSKKRTYYLIICGALVVAGVLSIISLVHYIEFTYGFRSSPTFCNISAKLNCDVVTQSSYSTILGIPVASYGILFYLAILMLAAAALYWKERLPLDRIDAVLFAAALYSCLFSIYLFVVSEFLIGALCPTCMGMYLCNIVFLVCAFRICRASPGKSLLAGLESALLVFPRAFLRNLKGGSLCEQVLHRGVISFLVLSILVLLVPWTVVSFVKPQKQAMSPQEVEKLVAQWKQETPVSFTFENEGLTRDYRKGNPFAPIVIVEFSDFECPFCHSVTFDLDELLADFGDQVQLVFKNFPLDKTCNSTMQNELHKHACYLAQIVRCAGEQELFWDAVDYVMGMKELTRNPRSREFLREFVTALGLDGTGLKECIDSGRHLQKLRSDVAQGAALGIDRTPTLFINNKKVSFFDRGVVREIIKAAGIR